MSKYITNTLNLRDLQEAIERNEYDSFPVKEWMDDHETNPVNESALFICPYDGTIYQIPGECPSPYHPYPRPRASYRLFLWVITIPAVIALIYSIMNNEALVELIVTISLLAATAGFFTVLFILFVKFWASISPESVKKRARFISQFTTLLSGFFAMLIVSGLRKQSPTITWWLIEFAIAFILENYLPGIVARLFLRRVLPDFDQHKFDDSLEKLIQECLQEAVPAISYRILFLVSSLSLGLWFLALIHFKGRYPPFWMIPFFLIPYFVWLWKSSERLLNLLECPTLTLLVHQDPELPLYADVLTKSVLAVLKPTEIERKNQWWQSPLFYISAILPPGGFIAAIVLLGL